MLHLPAIIAHHLTHLPKITQPQFQIQNSDSHFTSILIGLIFSPLILMAAISKIERAHRMYRDGAYEEALVFYSDALSIAKTNAQKIALHSNRAACFLKLLLFQKAADECTSVLELDINHTGALMLRAQTLVTLKEYQSALFDVNRLLELNPSSEVYQNLQARLKTQLSLAPIPEAETELEDTDNEEDPGEEELEDDDKMAGRGEGETGTTSSFTPESHGTRPSSDPDSNGWQAIPKPKGHSRLDYSRWDSVADDCSDDDDEGDDDEENRPRFRFMVKTVDVRPVK